MVSIGAIIHALLTREGRRCARIRPRGSGRASRPSAISAAAPAPALAPPPWPGIRDDRRHFDHRRRVSRRALKPQRPSPCRPRRSPAARCRPPARAAPRATADMRGAAARRMELPPLAMLAEPKKAVGRQDLRGRARAERAPARRRARGFRRQGRDHQRAPRPGGHALRARAGARHQVLARHRPRRRHRPLDVRRLRPRRRGAGAQRHRHRTAEPAARDRLSARTARLRGLREVEPQARHRARQDDRRRAGDRRSRPHAASARRRHHRLGQVGGDQHHDPVAALSAEARTSAGSSWSIRRCWSSPSTTASRIC